MKTDPSRIIDENTLYQRLSLALFGILSLTILLTFRDYGIAWDEEFQHPYGKLVLAYFTSFLSDTRVLTFENLYLYGGLFDLLVACTIKVTGFSDEYGIRHFLNALCGLVSVLGTWKLGTLLRKKPGGFWSALFLVLCPVYYGHMFNNPKDIPFAAGYVWSVYFICKAMTLFPKLPTSLIVKLSLAIGWAMGIRVGGLLLLCYLPVAGCLSWVGKPQILDSKKEQQKERSTPLGPFLLGLLKNILIIAAISYVIMLSAWPWAQLDPFIRPFTALEELSHFKFYGMVLFNGSEYPAVELPITYLPHLFFIQTPEIILILLFAGIVLSALFIAGRSKGRPKVSSATEREWISTPYQLIFILFAAIFPIAYVIFKKASLYDSFRQFLFIVPLLCCLAGYAMSSLLDHAKKHPFFSVGFPIVTGIYLLYHLSITVMYHPYQYIYFNNFAGGLPGAAGKYNLDYWGVALTEAIQKMLIAIETDPAPKKKEYKVFICGTTVSAKALFPPEVSITQNASEADFYLSVTRRNCHNMIPGTPIIVIERFGVPLAVVKDRRYPDGYP